MCSAAETRIPSEIDPKDPRSELFGALYEMTDIFWGVNNAHNGDRGQPPSCIRRARKALRACLSTEV